MRFEPRLCPVCGSARSAELFEDINRREGLSVSARLVECGACGMRFVNPAPEAASLESLYADGSIDPVGLSLERMSPAESSRASRRGLLLRAINGVLRGHPHDWPAGDGGGRSILDFGCLDGGKLVEWHRRGWRVAGIDLNEGGITMARRTLPDGTFWCGDVLDLAISDRFDFIRSDNVIEHLTEPVAVLSALRCLLKDGGRLRLFVPNGLALSAWLFGGYSAVYWMPFHINLFTRASLREALRRAGFREIRCVTYTPVGAWTWTQRQLFLKPGYNRRPSSAFDRLLLKLRLLNYPGETISQWLGLGEELIATAS